MTKYNTLYGIMILIVGVIFLPIPFYSNFYLVVYLIFHIPYLLFVLAIDLFVTKRKKKRKLKAYAGYVGLLLFSISFGMPAVKLFHQQPLFQMLIVGLWLLILALTHFYKDVMFQIIFEGNERYRIVRYIYLGFIFVVLLAGGGGFYKIPEYFNNLYGHEATMFYFSIILLLASYWMAIFAQSIVSKLKEYRT